MVTHKQKVNAMISYCFFAMLFLLPSKNLDIKNDFVQSHSRTAIMFHILLVIFYVIFIHYNYLGSVFVFSEKLNHLVMMSSSLVIFLLMLVGAYRANKGMNFSISQNIVFKKPLEIIGKDELTFGEKEKIYTVLAYVPFLGIVINSGKNNEPFFTISKFSSLIGVFFCILVAYRLNNVVSFTMLLYIIFLMFVLISMMVRNSILFFNLGLPTFEEIHMHFITILVYIKNLILGKEFIEYKRLLSYNYNLQKNKDEKERSILSAKNKCEINKKLFYVPFVNLIGLAFLRTSGKYHAINGLLITILILALPFIGLKWLVVFMAFPIAYGLANTDKLEYKIPFIFDIYAIIIWVIDYFKNFRKYVKETGEVREFRGKVEGK